MEGDAGNWAEIAINSHHESLPTPCQACEGSKSGLHPFDDDAVDATMSKTCQPATRRSRCHPRGRRVCRGRGSTVEALSRLRKRKLWPKEINSTKRVLHKTRFSDFSQKELSTGCVPKPPPYPRPNPVNASLTRSCGTRVRAAGPFQGPARGIERCHGTG